jgi:Gnt-I system high-affinity gluconate transporter
MFKEYLGISVKDTFKSWSVMEAIVSVVGLIGVMLLSLFL